MPHLRRDTDRLRDCPRTGRTPEIWAHQFRTRGTWKWPTVKFAWRGIRFLIGICRLMYGESCVLWPKGCQLST